MNSVCVCEIDVIFPHFIQTHFDWWAMYLFECVALYDPSAGSWIRDIPNKRDLGQIFRNRAQVKIRARLISKFVWLKRTVGGWFTYVKNSFWVAKKVKIPVLFLQRDVCLDFSHTLSKKANPHVWRMPAKSRGSIDINSWNAFFKSTMMPHLLDGEPTYALHENEYYTISGTNSNC